jgi:hypothetical protein
LLRGWEIVRAKAVTGLYWYATDFESLLPSMKRPMSTPGILIGCERGWGPINIWPPVAAAGSADRMKLGIVKEPFLTSSVHAKATKGTVRDSK